MRQLQSIRGNTDQKMTTMMESSKAFTHPWRTPVPYLFGGLAAMLGLIAFALLLLACSYWKFSQREEDRDIVDGEKQNESGEKVEAKVFEEKILVIMAGQDKPTFLATPVEAKTCVNCGEIVVITENREGQKGESTFTDVSSSSSDEENH